MSAFTGNSVSATGSSLETAPTPITNNGFFPDLDLADLRNAMRIVDAVTDERLRAVALDALLDINNELTAWRLAQIAQGYAALDEIPADEVDGEHELLIRYRRAIYHTVDAALVEDYADMDNTATAEKHAENMKDRQRTARRDAHRALTAILQHEAKQAGKPPITVIVGTI